jgi:hypothetical protein
MGRWRHGFGMMTLALAGVIVSACGDEAGTGGSGGGADPSCDPPCPAGQACSAGQCLPANEDGCIELTDVTAFRFDAGADSGWFTAAYGAGFEPQLAEGWQVLQMKLNDGAIGSFDLSQEPLDTGACERCVFVAYGGSGDHFQLDLATSGTLVIDEIDEATGQARGRLVDVTMRHVEEVALHSFQGPASSHCVHVAEIAFDTRAIDGGACLSQGDCPNGMLQGCDPRTKTCVAAPCTRDAPTCPGTDACIVQHALFGAGACYQTCEPFTTGSCPAAQDCIPTDYLGDVGVCRHQGPDAPDPVTDLGPERTCDPYHVATGCGPGHVCTNDAPYWHYNNCVAQCDYFSESPGCAGDGVKCAVIFHSQADIDTTWLCGAGDCHYGGICISGSEEGAFGEPCAEGYDEGWDCAGDATHLGRCVSDDDGALRCRRPCRLGGDECGGGETCTQLLIGDPEDDPRVIAGVGLCLPG